MPRLEVEPFRLPFTNTTRLDIPGTMHQRGTARVLIRIYGEPHDYPIPPVPTRLDDGIPDPALPLALFLTSGGQIRASLRVVPVLMPDVITVHPTTHDVTIRWVDHPELYDPFAVDGADTPVRRVYKWFRRQWLCRMLLGTPLVSRVIPAVPQSGTVVITAP